MVIAGGLLRAISNRRSADPYSGSTQRPFLSQILSSVQVAWVCALGYFLDTKHGRESCLARAEKVACTSGNRLQFKRDGEARLTLKAIHKVSTAADEGMICLRRTPLLLWQADACGKSTRS